MKINALHKDTRVCMGIYEIDSLDSWKDHGLLVLSPRHDGQTGWILDDNNVWIDPTAPTEEQKWIAVKRNRNGLLAKTDIYLLNDFPITAEQKAKIITYRQQLRDIPITYTNADDVVFPEVTWK